MLNDMVGAMIVAGEMQYRLAELARREHLIELKKRLIEEAQQKAEEEKQRIAHKRRQREQAKIDRLLAESEALQQATTIRAYVAAVRVANSNRYCPLSETELNVWANDALAQADRIDPVESGAFLHLEPEEAEDDRIVNL